MIDIRNQIQCYECEHYHDSDGYCWCSFWTNRADMDGTYGEVIEIYPDGYCSEAMQKEATVNAD